MPKVMHRLLKRCNQRAVWFIVFSAAVIVVLVSPPQFLVDEYHEWKAARYADAAQRAAAGGDWELAKAHAESGLHWAPNSPVLRKIMIDAVAKQGRAIDSGLLAEQFFDPAATLEDRAHLMEIALDGGDQVAFSRFYNRLPESDRSHPDVIVQRMRLGLQLGRHEEVEQLFENLPVSERSAAAHITRVAARVLGASSEGEWEAVSDEISSLLNDEQIGTDTKWSVFRLIAGIPDARLDSKKLSNALHWLSTNEETATVADQLIGASIKMSAMNVEGRGAYRKKIIQTFGESSPAELAHWLVKLGFPDEALQLPALSRARASGRLAEFDARLEALVATGRWSDALDWLKQPPAGSHKVMLWLSRAKIADKLGDRSLRRQSLTRAIEEAGVVTTENRFFAIYEVALALEEMDLASKAAIEGMRVQSAILPPSPYFLPVLRYLWEQDRLNEFRNLNLTLLSRQPGDLDRSNDELYVSLLLDENPRLDQMIKIGHRLVEMQPANVSFRTTLAWLLLRSGKPADAGIVLEAGDIDWDTAAAADKLVRAHVISANGDSDTATRIAESIEVPNGLSEVEVEKLLKPLQARRR